MLRAILHTPGASHPCDLLVRYPSGARAFVNGSQVDCVEASRRSCDVSLGELFAYDPLAVVTRIVRISIPPTVHNSSIVSHLSSYTSACITSGEKVIGVVDSRGGLDPFRNVTGLLYVASEPTHLAVWDWRANGRSMFALVKEGGTGEVLDALHYGIEVSTDGNVEDAIVPIGIEAVALLDDETRPSIAVGVSCDTAAYEASVFGSATCTCAAECILSASCCADACPRYLDSCLSANETREAHILLPEMCIDSMISQLRLSRHVASASTSFSMSSSSVVAITLGVRTSTTFPAHECAYLENVVCGPSTIVVVEPCCTSRVDLSSVLSYRVEDTQLLIKASGATPFRHGLTVLCAVWMCSILLNSVVVVLRRRRCRERPNICVPYAKDEE